jgi:hypothetical protein
MLASHACMGDEDIWVPQLLLLLPQVWLQLLVGSSQAEQTSKYNRRLMSGG